MGNAAYRQTTIGNNQSTQADNVTNFMQIDLPKFVKQSQIGNGKFMKSYIMRVDSTQVVVKVYMRLPDEDLSSAIRDLTYTHQTISSKFPNLLPYQMWMRSASRNTKLPCPVYLIRQHFHSNLYDRLSTRPFLVEIEKLWILFQIFKSLEICHATDIIHGDVKPENIMCTTANWVVLTDFAPFKPVMLPNDDPTDFQYYYDAMGRNKCYIAPERFFKRVEGNSPVPSTPTPSTPLSRFRGTAGTAPKTGQTKGVHTAAMDVFSLGCVMAEVLLDGAVLFDLPSMLQYLSSSVESLAEDELSTPKVLLGRIANPHLRNVIIDMTQKDPEKRLSVSAYLSLLQGKTPMMDLATAIPAPPSGTSSPLPPSAPAASTSLAIFPAYLDATIYPLYMKLHWSGVTPDDRVVIIGEAFTEIITSLTGKVDQEGASFFNAHMLTASRLLHSAGRQDQLLLPALTTVAPPKASAPAGVKIREEVLRAAYPNGKAIKVVSVPEEVDLLTRARQHILAVQQLLDPAQAMPTSSTPEEVLESFSDVLLSGSSELFTPPTGSGQHAGMVIIIDLLCSSYRHLRYLPSRTLSILLLLRFGLYTTEVVVLTRIIPILLVALEDPQGCVRILGMRVLCALIKTTQNPDANYANYLFYYFNKLIKDPDIAVRATFAELLGVIGNASKRFLENTYLRYLQENKDGDAFPYDAKLEQLKDQVGRWIRDLIIDTSMGAATGNASMGPRTRSNMVNESSVKKALLSSMHELCVFFGQEGSMDKILTQALTFLNDPDWELRKMFVEKVGPVAVYLGSTVTSEYILPCMEHTLVDIEERVICSALHTLQVLVAGNLVSKSLIVDYLPKVLPLLLHPCAALRTAAVEAVGAIHTSLGVVDSAVFLTPLLTPLRGAGGVTLPHLLGSVRAPLTKEALRGALLAAIKEHATSAGVALRLPKIQPCTPEEVASATVVQEYVKVAGREVLVKSLKWRLLAPTPQGVAPSAQLARLNITSSSILHYLSGGVVLPPTEVVFDGLLAPTTSVEASNTLTVPATKTMGYTSEEVRRGPLYLTTSSEVRNKTLLRTLYLGSVEDDSTALPKGWGGESSAVLKRIKALQVPPLAVDMGTLLSTSSEEKPATESDSYTPWRPSQGILLSTLREHSASVNRLVVSPDSAYFASASSDCTVRVWATRNLGTAFPRSAATYMGHAEAVTDAVAVENTHSIASASKDGSLHVWRVDMIGGTTGITSSGAAGREDIAPGTARVSGTALIRVVRPEEGPIAAVQHYCSDTASVVTYATQTALHGWDLRMSSEAFCHTLRPELGAITAMTLSPERQWIALGSSRGYLALWDIRYGMCNALWQHCSHAGQASSAAPAAIHRLATCKSLSTTLPATDGVYMFVASNNNEASIWGLPEAGEALKCFRSLPLNDSKNALAPLPVLKEVALPVHPNKPIAGVHGLNNAVTPSVRAMIGRISPYNSSYLITAGSDKHIRFWDFRAPENCYTIGGLEATQSKSLFVAPKQGNEQGKLFVCYTSSVVGQEKILQSQLPLREGRGLVTPSINFHDAVTDLKDIDTPMRLLLSSSRDGEIKLWR